MQESLYIRDAIIVLILIITIVWVTKKYNMWGSRKGSQKAKEEKKADDKEFKHRRRMAWLMRQCEGFCKTVGGNLNEKQRYDWQFRIGRKRVFVPILGREFKPEEIVGILRLITFFLCAIGIATYLATQTIVLLSLCIVGIFAPTLFKFLLDSSIAQDDVELEKDFPDLYMLLYSRLGKGANARIGPTLADYYNTLDSMYAKDEHKVMRNFLQDFRNAIDLYSDEMQAIPLIREKYKSATIVNFCNLAMQSLRGVDNKDKLLAFKMELSNRRKQEMEETAQKLVERGNKAIMIIFVILFQFIVISWSSKFTFSMPSLF